MTVSQPVHAGAYFALLAAELYTSTALLPSTRSPVEAAQILLQAAATLTRFPLLCALLTERAAGYYVQAGLYRRYAFHEVLAGHKYHVCGKRAIKQAIVCFAVAMIFHEDGQWNAIKSKLCRALSDELRGGGPTDARRGLLFLLRSLCASAIAPVGPTGTLADPPGDRADLDADWTCRFTFLDSFSAYRELSSGGPWGNVVVLGEWRGVGTRGLLLGDLPVMDPPDPSTMGTDGGAMTIHGLCVPEVIRSSSALVLPAVFESPEDEGHVNQHTTIRLPRPTVRDVSSREGVNENAGHRIPRSMAFAMVQSLTLALLVENEYVKSMQAQPTLGGDDSPLLPSPGAGGPAGYHNKSVCFPLIYLPQLLVDAEACLQDPMARNMSSSLIGVAIQKLNIISTSTKFCLGEPIKVQLEIQNHFLVPMSVYNAALEFDTPDAFEAVGEDFVIQGGSTLILVLQAKPLRLGKYSVVGVNWHLGWVHVKQSLRKKGILLQRTMKQREHRERAPDTSLTFEVCPAQACLRLRFTGFPSEVLQGQVCDGTLLILNDGVAGACNINLKFSQSCFLLSLADESSDAQRVDDDCDDNKPTESEISWVGESASVFALPAHTVILPKESFNLKVKLRLESAGSQQLLGVLASYGTYGGDVAGTDPVPHITAVPIRTSFSVFEVSRV